MSMILIKTTECMVAPIKNQKAFIFIKQKYICITCFKQICSLNGAKLNIPIQFFFQQK